MRCLQGRPSYFIDMRIVDGEGRELPRDGKAHGDLQVRGPHVVATYFRVRAAAAGCPPHPAVHNSPGERCSQPAVCLLPGCWPLVIRSCAAHIPARSAAPACCCLVGVCPVGMQQLHL